MALVKYNAKNVYSCLNIRLIPGVNQVEDRSLKLVLDQPLFKHRVDKGIIEIIVENKGKGKKEENKQIVDLMPHVYDVKLLRKYILNDDKAVKQSAKKQLKIIESVEVKEEVEVGVTIK